MKKQHKFPKLSHLLLIFVAIVILRISFYAATDGFSLFKIENTFPVEKQWVVPITNKKALQEITKSPFTYLAKGSQAYAFESQDGTYVLKLFKCYHLTPGEWLNSLYLPESLHDWRDQIVQKRRKKIDQTLSSYKIAATKLRTECGIIAMQILPSNTFTAPVTIYDKLGRKFTIDLQDYGFILQKKANLIYPSMTEWIKNDDLDSAKKAINSIFDLIVTRSKKGIQDSDPDLHKNAGLINTDAIFIDVGSFHYNPDAASPSVYREDLKKISNNLKNWLHAQSPELSDYMNDLIEKK